MDYFPVFVLYRDLYDNTVISDSVRDTVSFRLVNDHTISYFVDALRGQDFAEICISVDVNESFEQFYNIIMYHYNICCPIFEKSIKKKDIIKPWIDVETKIQIRKRDKFYKLYRVGLMPQRVYKKFRNKVTELKRREYFERKFFQFKKDTTALWKLINNETCISKGEC